MPPKSPKPAKSGPPAYLTTAQVAQHYGVSAGRIRQVVAARSIRPDAIYSGTSLWLPSRLDALNPRVGKPGRRRKN